MEDDYDEKAVAEWLARESGSDLEDDDDKPAELKPQELRALRRNKLDQFFNRNAAEQAMRDKRHQDMMNAINAMSPDQGMMMPENGMQ